ncbi:hypothetical protein K466DRAFT_211862 [Polyporus arcularius HHB13444]|uniref:Uncharacterized protein n=1 Tax=Polyporus arcularius HHB13444 TaxID=1314778 RepID=A0A5C3PSL9_9APHY|nr:hypothetical protein K466DRAFT_211862 [Polyporus arcularius HHB13444]
MPAPRICQHAQSTKPSQLLCDTILGRYSPWCLPASLIARAARHVIRLRFRLVHASGTVGLRVGTRVLPRVAFEIRDSTIHSPQSTQLQSTEQVAVQVQVRYRSRHDTQALAREQAHRSLLRSGRSVAMVHQHRRYSTIAVVRRKQPASLQCLQPFAPGAGRASFATSPWMPGA